MKYLIASDFHGDNDSFDMFKDIISLEQPNAIYLLGDLINSYDYIYFNNTFSNVFVPIIVVAGNCDDEYTLSKLNVGYKGIYTYELINNRALFFTHGHIYNDFEKPLGMGNKDILFMGHKHIPSIQNKKTGIFVCVGSMSRPRGGSKQSYCLFEDNVIKIKELYTQNIINELII